MPTSRASNSAPLIRWPHSAIHTGGRGSPGASRKACTSWSSRCFSGRGSGAAEHHHRAGSGVRVGLPDGLGMGAVLGEVAGGLRGGAGAGGGDGECAAGGVPDDDERRGFLAVEHAGVVPVWSQRWFSHSFISWCFILFSWKLSTVPILVATFAPRPGLLAGPCFPATATTRHQFLGSSQSSCCYTRCMVAVVARTAESGPARHRPCIAPACSSCAVAVT